MIDKPGIYSTSREEYDADPVATPSLSASVAKLLLERTAAHAYLAHPRLNKDYVHDAPRKFDLGNVAHALMLGETDKIKLIKADNYRKKDAQAERDAILEAGLIPILEPQLEEAHKMAAAARRQLKNKEEGQGLFEEALGRAEHTIVWETDGVWCRGRPDWISKSGNIVADYKTTAESANPDRWVRTMYNVQGDLQPAHYLEGLERITGKQWQWRWVVQEIEPPYALQICAPSEEMVLLGAAKMLLARNKWRWSLEHNAWPGYSRETAYLGVPPWEEKGFLAKIEREAVRKQLDDEELRKRAIEAQAPDAATAQRIISGMDKEITP